MFEETNFHGYYLFMKTLFLTSAGFTYRLDRMKPRASNFRGPPAKVHNIIIFNTVIGLSHLCCHNRTVLLQQSFFLTQLYSISEY